MIYKKYFLSEKIHSNMAPIILGNLAPCISSMALQSLRIFSSVYVWEAEIFMKWFVSIQQEEAQFYCRTMPLNTIYIWYFIDEIL